MLENINSLIIYFFIITYYMTFIFKHAICTIAFTFWNLNPFWYYFLCIKFTFSNIWRLFSHFKKLIFITFRQKNSFEEYSLFATLIYRSDFDPIFLEVILIHSILKY